MSRAGAGRIDLLGGRAVHPVRHPGRQPRLRDDRRRHRPERQGTMEVLLVAAKKDKIADYTNVITQAGRTPVVVDVDAFALQNAYEANYGVRPGGVVALLNAGASAININILSGAQSVFTPRRLDGRQRVHRGRAEGTGPAVRGRRGAEEGAAASTAPRYEDARPVLRAMTDNVLLEVEKTFDFFKATASNDHIDRIVLSGGASRVEGFAEALRERFDTPVERFDPFRQVTFDAGRLGRCRPRKSRRSPPWPSASRCAGRATDDSRQPPCRRTARGQGRAAVRSRSARRSPSAAPRCWSSRRSASAGATGRSGRPRRSVERDIADGEARRSAPRRGPQAGRGVRGAARASCSSASR